MLPCRSVGHKPCNRPHYSFGCYASHGFETQSPHALCSGNFSQYTRNCIIVSEVNFRDGSWSWRQRALALRIFEADGFRASAFPEYIVRDNEVWIARS
jgi:hypothetical protein